MKHEDVVMDREQYVKAVSSSLGLTKSEFLNNYDVFRSNLTGRMSHSLKKKIRDRIASKERSDEWDSW